MRMAGPPLSTITQAKGLAEKAIQSGLSARVEVRTDDGHLLFSCPGTLRKAYTPNLRP